MTEQVEVVDSGFDETRTVKLTEAKALFNSGRRNYLIKNYDVAADELSEVCSIYEELNGPLCDELGMPYLLYAKCLIFLAVDETKVLDVPNEEDEEDEGDEDGEDDEDDDDAHAHANGNEAEKVAHEPESSEKDIKSKQDSTVVEAEPKVQQNGEKDITNHINNGQCSPDSEKTTDKISETNKAESINDTPTPSSSTTTDVQPGSSSDTTENAVQDEVEGNEVANDLQIAWETLELAGKIFSKQGMSGLPNLAEVHTELGNIEFENNIPDKAREDYEKALLIYKELPIKTYRRAMAEVNYKIGLTYILQESAPDGVEPFKTACEFLNDEINDIKSKEEMSEKDKDNVQDMEETQQEILDKITEIEETRQQCVEKVRAALDNFITPVQKSPEKSVGTSVSATSSKPTDISHLIKRKKQGDSSLTEEASPAKRPAL